MSEFREAISLARELVNQLGDDEDSHYALRLAAMTYAWAMHVGNSAKWIREAEAEECTPEVGCERQDVFMLCEDEYGNSHHPKMDEIHGYVEVARVMLGALIELEAT